MLIDGRSLAFDHLIAEHLRLEPDLVQKTRAALSRPLQTTAPNSAPVLFEWLGLLDDRDLAGRMEQTPGADW